MVGDQRKATGFQCPPNSRPDTSRTNLIKRLVSVYCCYKTLLSDISIMWDHELNEQAQHQRSSVDLSLSSLAIWINALFLSWLKAQRHCRTRTESNLNICNLKLRATSRHYFLFVLSYWAQHGALGHICPGCRSHRGSVHTKESSQQHKSHSRKFQGNPLQSIINIFFLPPPHPPHPFQLNLAGQITWAAVIFNESRGDHSEI